MGDEFEDDQDSTNTLSTTYNPDGSVFYQEPGGGSYTYRPDGTIVTGSGANEAIYNPSTGLATYVDPKYFDPATGKYDWAKFAIGAGGLAGALNANKGMQGGAGAGYQGGIPTLYGGRTMMTAPPKMVDGKPRRPGQAGVNYGGDVTYFNTKAEVDQGVIDNARRSGVGLPDDWSTYSPQQKIDWFNANKISADQMLAAGVKQSDIDYMLQNGYMGFPSGWNSFTGEQKAKWFNDKKITPDQLSKYGVTPEELAWMRSHGYTIGATTTDNNDNKNAGKTIGTTKLPADWDGYDQTKKITWYNNNGITPAQLLAAGVTQAQIDSMYANGYTVGKPAAPTNDGSGQVIGSLKTPAGWNSLTPANKIKWYNDNGITPAQLLTAGQKQSDIDYMRANGYTVGANSNNNSSDSNNNSAGLPSLPANFQGKTAKEKADLYNSLLNEKYTDAQIRQAAGTQTDADWTALQNLAKPPAQSTGLKYALGNKMTEQQYLNNIENWLQSNKNATDKEVADQMTQYGISADDLVRAHPGFKLEDVKKKLHDLGVEGYAEGGKARYLRGQTDGMADEIPSSIGGKEPAALSHGEFVIPADVVSHLGNGNSDAGAKKLYQMMDKLRMARTGTKKQGKKINPDKFMPGGLAQAYAQGGAVKHFETGGSTGVAPAVSAGVTGIESNLSNWAGPYVTNMLGKGKALSEMPYQAYTGPLTAGQSGLQEKVSTGLQGINFPGNLGQSFASSTPTGAPTMPADMSTYGPQQKADLYNKFRSQGYGDQAIRQASGTQTDSDWQYLQDLAAKSGPMNIPQQQGLAGSYMNPYLQNVLQPQLAELSRQSQINLQPGLAKLTAAGGYGGGRQAIMESESNRNLLNAQNKTIGEGYANAYDKAMQQFNTEQGQSKTLVDMMAGQGATDRGITAEGIAADKAQFEEARENPYKMVQYQQSLLQGMPLSAQAYNTTGESALVAAARGATTVAELLKKLGITLPG